MPVNPSPAVPSTLGSPITHPFTGNGPAADAVAAPTAPTSNSQVPRRYRIAKSYHATRGLGFQQGGIIELK